MSAGLCALFLRLPQLPSVEANAASNWATGRAWRRVGWAQRWLPLVARDGLAAGCLKTPGGRRALERAARSGQQEWPFASVLTIIEGAQEQKSTRPYLSRMIDRLHVPRLDITLDSILFLREKPATFCQWPLGSLNSPPKSRKETRAMCTKRRLPGQWVFYLPCGGLTHFPGQET